MASAFKLCKSAWGDKHGYVVLSLANPETEAWRDVPFKWPDQAAKIQTILNNASKAKHDIYWAPMVFSKPKRQRQVACSTNWLWADLDEVDPREINDAPSPSVYWETSPGRWQALWQLDREIPPEIQTAINKGLTYKIGADKGGLDLTQVLRLPGTPNYKYEDVRVGAAKLNGNKPIKLEKVSPFIVSGGGSDSETPTTADLPSPELVLKRHRRRIPARAKQLLKAKSRNVVVGKRSERLWELECLLAEAGLKTEEIISLAQSSVWNKFEGRHDELDRLSSEANKALAKVSDTTTPTRVSAMEEVGDDGASDPDSETGDEDFPRPKTWRQFDREHRPIDWLVVDLWGKAEVGFISGHPKAYKSWLALDLGVSVSTGTRYLGPFRSKKANVLIIQEEDPKPVIQDRLVRIAASKGLVYSKWINAEEFEMRYELPDNLYVVSNVGFQVTDEDWMDQIKSWIEELDIDLLILDPLMMMASEMDEFRAFEMMAKVLKPLKRLRAETQVAVCVVHHHTKADKTGAAAMYGSVALWAWEESGVHLTVSGPNKLTAERFSKHAQLGPLSIEIPDIEDGWNPIVYKGSGTADLLSLLATYEDGATIDDLTGVTNLKRDALQRQLKKLLAEGKVKREASPRRPGEKGRRKALWSLAERG